MTNVTVSNQETWKDIPNFEGLYQASNKSRIKRLKKISYSGKDYRIIHVYEEKIVKSRMRGEYLSVNLSKDGAGKDFSVHRIIAKLFVLNPDNKPFVNHKDGNKLNNDIENLEWCTVQENVIHAIKTGLIVNPSKNFGCVKMALNGRARKVSQLNFDGSTIKVWSCITEAAIHLRVKRKSISDAANGRQKTCAGYKWEIYKEN